jgi:mannosyltransferase OCH1-like enzyme
MVERPAVTPFGSFQQTSMRRKQQRLQPYVLLVQLGVFVWSTLRFAYLCFPQSYSEYTFKEETNIAAPQSQKLLTLRQLTTGTRFDARPIKKSVNVTCNKLYRKYISNIDLEQTAPKSSSTWFDIKKNHVIPKFIHQTAKSRCVTLKVGNAIHRWWSLSDWGFSYYFQDDDAVQVYSNATPRSSFPC